MANTDITITMAGQLASGMTTRQLKLAEIAMKMVVNLGSATKGTVAQWNTLLATSESLFPQQCFRNFPAQRAACHWQNAIGTVAGMAGKTNNQILDLTSYLQGLNDWQLDALNLYLEGKSCLINSVYT